MSSTGGNLIVRGDPTADLTITQTGLDLFTVTDGAFTYPPVTVTKHINVVLGDDADNVSINLLTAGAGTNISVSLGEGANILNIAGLNGNDGLISGNLLIRSGSGEDSIFVGDKQTGVDIAGTARFITGDGVDSVSIFGGSQITGGITVTNANVFTFGIGTGAATALGTLSFTAHSESLPSVITIGANALVSKRLFVRGGDGPNIVDIEGDTLMVAQFMLGGGLNQLNVKSTASLGNALYYTGGVGDDSVTIEAGAQISGLVNVSLGDGTNSLIAEAGSTVGKDFKVRGSGLLNEVAVASSVTGNLYFYFTGARTELSMSGAVGGTSIYYRGSSGVDDVTFGATAANARLLVTMGDGNDILRINSAEFKSGRADGGDGTGDDLNATTPIVQRFDILNFEA